MKVILNNEQQIDVSDKLLTCPNNNALVSQVINSYIRKGHIGTKKQKNRSQVAHGHARVPMFNRKSNRARLSAPHFRKGGVCFAASGLPKRQHKINKKSYRKCLFILLSELFRIGNINFIDSFCLDSYKIKDFPFPIKDKYRVLILVGESEFTDNLILATRNIHKITVLTSILRNKIPKQSPRIKYIKPTNPYDLYKHTGDNDVVFITKEYIKDIESIYGL